MSEAHCAELLTGYPHGPDAPAVATGRALSKLDAADAVIVVEGISDQIAIETLAARRGRDLVTEAIVVLPIGGAQAATRYLTRLGSGGADVELTGMCDADGVEAFCDGLAAAGLGSPTTVAEMASLGFYVCVEDLEDELIRAVGPAGVEAALDGQGEIGAFRTMQSQPHWRAAPVDQQLHRFLGTRARRSLRYARLLIEAVELDRMPPPLDAVLAAV